MVITPFEEKRVLESAVAWYHVDSWTVGTVWSLGYTLASRSNHADDFATITLLVFHTFMSGLAAIRSIVRLDRPKR